MAYVYDPTKDEKQQQAMGAGAPPPTPTGTSGTGTQGTSGAAKPTGSGQFTNLQSYIRANENTDAGKQVGAGVLSSPDASIAKTTADVGKLTSMTPGSGPQAMDKADEDFLTSYQAPTPAASAPPRPERDTLAPPGSGPFGGTGGLAGAAGQQASGQAQIDQAAVEKEKYDTIMAKYAKGPGAYSGPSIQDVKDAEAAAIASRDASAKQLGVLKGDNTAGRSELLQSTYGKDKQYSGGENKLDSFLLERNFGDQFDPKFQQGTTKLADLSKTGSDASGKLQSDITGVQKQYTDATEKWRTLLGGAGGAIAEKEASGQATKQSGDTAAAAGEKVAQTQDTFNAEAANQEKSFNDQMQAAIGSKDGGEMARVLREWEAWRKEQAYWQDQLRQTNR